MRTEVAILHNEYPARVREFVDTKIQGLAKFYDRTSSVRALLERQNEEHRVELVAKVNRGVVLVVDGRADSLQQALDRAFDRMARVLARHKDKLSEHVRRKTRAMP